MFDLFRSRDKAVRILLGGILVVVSFSMLTYLIPSYNSGAADAGDQVVADIGKGQLTLPEVQQAIQQTVRGSQIPPSVLPNYIPQMVDELIMQRALAFQAETLGFQVTDAEMTKVISEMIPGLFPDGKFVGTEAYSAFLAQQNLSITEFETNLRRQMLISRLRDIALQGIIITPAEIEQAYRRKNEQIKVEWVKLTADQYRGESQPTAEEVQAYFKANTARYQSAEKRNLAVLLADPAKIEQTLTPADADLQRLYNDGKEAFRTPERVKVRHILLKTSDKPASEDPKIRAKAEDLLKQIRGGANFADLAKKFSEDATSANNAKSPGELPDWITRGQTVPEFEKVAFTLKPTQTSDVVKTQYGYHIIQVLAHEDARLRPFDEAKADLTAQWKKQRVNDLMQTISDQAQAALQKDPSNPDKVAAQFNVQVLRVNDFQAGQPLPDVGMSPDFGQAVGSLKQGEVSQPVAFNDNKIAIAVVTGVTPARPSTLAEVEGSVRETLVANRSAAALQKHVQELADAGKKFGNLAQAAKSMGLQSKVSAEVNRAGSVEGLGPASYLDQAFTKPDGSIVGPVNLPDGAAVAQVTQHIAADMIKLGEQITAIRDELKRQKESDRYTLFSEGVRQTLTGQGKIKVHAPVLQRLIASFKSNS